MPSDSTFTVESPKYSRSQALYYRNIVGVVFDHSAGGGTIRDLLMRYHATIIGGAAGPSDSVYVLEVPDPGVTMQDLEALLASLEREPGISRVETVSYRSPSSLYTPTPVDSPGLANTPWPILTDRLPDLDTSRVVRIPNDTFQLFRTDISLRFKAGISDSTKRAFLLKHAMSVLGVTQSRLFFVRIPDPGPTAQNLFDALESLRRAPEIGIVSFIPRTSLLHAEDFR